MLCPRCASPLPLWPDACPRCGLATRAALPLEPPADLALARPAPGAAPPAAAAVLPAPLAEGCEDFRTHIAVGALLAFVSTLVLPIFFGPIAMGLGWMAYARGRGAQRTQGLAVLVFAAVATAIGTYLGLWASQTLVGP